MTDLKTKMKDLKDLKKDIFEKNQTIVQAIKDDQTLIQQTDEALLLNKEKLNSIAKDDAKVRNDKKQKLSEITKYEKKVAELETEKSGLAEKFQQL